MRVRERYTEFKERERVRRKKLKATGPAVYAYSCVEQKKIHIFTKHNFSQSKKKKENLQIIIHCLIVIHNI